MSVQPTTPSDIPTLATLPPATIARAQITVAATLDDAETVREVLTMLGIER
jgi:hypothetical protein